MLDDLTKKRINTLRQILVGKLPDPKAQVEQITNGLIYKFMNDMDEQSVSMGGKSTYFSGEFQKYSWKNLMDTKTSGVEKIKLFSEAIEQMYTNENLPELFREIFKNSFLPFKDPSTLNMFLKEINEFHYSNSEKLGDAFEYLLSFMGSQGDAGQFRTPRHIIDFIVEIINPQKNETILDPACGTAGFLISSYKHILNQNTKKNLGDGLTASDRKKIGENLNGYDISPDMVKISLVNMYLHKFTNPKINEYDSLSSEDRWNEYYDVILANPPFFSPRGGIQPHNRFSIKSIKAELLFVDYIHQHLKPNGRAGIIVPDGVIMQEGNAYTDLRKNIISNSLKMVISLPPGIFNPYSDVRTAIIILQKNIKDSNVLFGEIKSDGYNLNKTRNPIKDNDLPEILSSIKDKKFNNKFFAVDRKILLKTKKYYFLPPIKEISLDDKKYEYRKLTDVIEFVRGVTYKKSDEVFENGQKILRANNINLDGTINLEDIKEISKNKKLKPNQRIKKNDILICIASGSKKHIGKVTFFEEDTNYYFGGFMGVLRAKNINAKYLYYILSGKKFNEYLKDVIRGANINNIKFETLNNFKLPLPLFKEQEFLVRKINQIEDKIKSENEKINEFKNNIIKEVEKIWN